MNESVGQLALKNFKIISIFRLLFKSNHCSLFKRLKLNVHPLATPFFSSERMTVQDKPQSDQNTPSKGTPCNNNTADLLSSELSEKASLASNEEPHYIRPRIEMFERLKEKHEQELKERPSSSITVSLPDGRTFDGQSWKMTPLEVAKLMGSQTIDNAVVAKARDKRIFEIFTGLPCSAATDAPCFLTKWVYRSTECCMILFVR